MQGTGSPERDRVDEQLGIARNLASRLDSSQDSLRTRIQIHLAEALVRQIRDLDDDVWNLMGAVREGNADLITALDGGLTMNISNLPEGKKGLFS